MSWHKRHEWQISIAIAVCMGICGIVLCATGRWYGITPIIVAVVMAARAKRQTT